MQSNATLLTRIKLLAGLSSVEKAHAALKATLAALGDVLSEGERASLADALPADLARALHAGDRPDVQAVDDLVERVAHYEHVSVDLARAHAQATCRALGDELDPDAWRALLRVLPDSFLELFQPVTPDAPPPWQRPTVRELSNSTSPDLRKRN